MLINIQSRRTYIIVHSSMFYLAFARKNLELFVPRVFLTESLKICDYFSLENVLFLLHIIPFIPNVL